MYLLILILVLEICDTYANNTVVMPARRVLFPSHYKNSAPYAAAVKMPHTKVIPASPLFSHSVAWKAKQSSDVAKSNDHSQQDLEVTQFHSQDTNGQVIFGFNAPDQMRIETRNADGSVHGTYSYVDPYGQVIKRQYWDTGAGFHVTSNTYPFNNGSPQEQSEGIHQQQQYTPEVQAARDLHFQLYQQALAAVLPKGERQEESKKSEVVINPLEGINVSANTEENQPSNGSDTLAIIDSIAVSGNPAANNESNMRSDKPSTRTEEIGLSKEHNGTIIIQNPEYLRISWTTDTKSHHKSNRRENLTEVFINGILNTNKHDNSNAEEFGNNGMKLKVSRNTYLKSLNVKK